MASNRHSHLPEEMATLSVITLIGISAQEGTRGLVLKMDTATLTVSSGSRLFGIFVPASPLLLLKATETATLPHTAHTMHVCLSGILLASCLSSAFGQVTQWNYA